MTFHITIGIDPGMTGAISVLVDGAFDRFIDMPTRPTKDGKKNEIDSRQMAGLLRELQQRHAGATFTAIVEQVNAMPSIPGANGERRSMGSQSAFRFGQSYGTVLGVVESLGFGLVLVPSSTWKKSVGLRGTAKDFARTLAMNTFPTAAKHLVRKKDIGRADSLMIARWGDQSEARADIRTPPPVSEPEAMLL